MTLDIGGVMLREVRDMHRKWHCGYIVAFYRVRRLRRARRQSRYYVSHGKGEG